MILHRETPKGEAFLARLRSLDASRPHTRTEIALAANCSAEFVRQVEMRALRKMRFRAEKLGLQDELRSYFER